MLLLGVLGMCYIPSLFQHCSSLNISLDDGGQVIPQKSSTLGEPVGKFQHVWHHGITGVFWFLFFFLILKESHLHTKLPGCWEYAKRLCLIFIYFFHFCPEWKRRNLLDQTWKILWKRVHGHYVNIVLLQECSKSFWKAVESIQSFCSFPKSISPVFKHVSKNNFSKRVALQS